MNVEAIRKFCLAFPQTKEKLQWGDALCFKVNAKIFAILGSDDPRICFKCDPETFAALIEQVDIRPAPHLGRYKWILLERLDALSWVEIQELIEKSYTMISAKTRKKPRHKKKSKTVSRRKPPAQ